MTVSAYLLAGLAVVALGCHGRDVQTGKVTAHNYVPAYTWLLPVANYCGQNCTFYTYIPMTDPELWQIEVTEQPPCPEDGCRSQWMNVSGPGVQAAHPIGSEYRP